MSKERRPLAELRSAIARRDGPAVVSALDLLDLRNVAQLAGEGLLVALAQDVPGANDLARRCTSSLQDRDWEGDHDLAALLVAALGEAPEVNLLRVPVELDELAFILEGDGRSGDGRIDLVTGEVWTGSAIDYAEEGARTCHRPTILIAGSTSAPRARGTATGTWRTSLPASTTRTVPISSRSRSVAMGRSVASET